MACRLGQLTESVESFVERHGSAPSGCFGEHDPPPPAGTLSPGNRLDSMGSRGSSQRPIVITRRAPLDRRLQAPPGSTELAEVRQPHENPAAASSANSVSTSSGHDFHSPCVAQRLVAARLCAAA
jgi:hypothetical protein